MLIYINCLNLQILTLQASNMTSEDLTLTILAPTSFTSPPSVVSLSNSPVSPFSASTELASDRRTAHGHKVDSGSLSVSVNEQNISTPEGVPKSDMGCSHLWLQSRVPLGYVISNISVCFAFESAPYKFSLLVPDMFLLNLQQPLNLKSFL